MHKNVFLIIFFWIVFLQYKWLAPHGIKAIFQLQKNIEKQENENRQIKKEINDLLNETYRLEHDDFYVEQLIRDQNLYAYPNEQITWQDRQDYKK